MFLLIHQQKGASPLRAVAERPWPFRDRPWGMNVGVTAEWGKEIRAVFFSNSWVLRWYTDGTDEQKKITFYFHPQVQNFSEE